MGITSQSSIDNLEKAFAVYCGAGVYVQAVTHSNNHGFIQTGPQCGALAVSRRVAIGALHAARGAGLNAWLVRHPARVSA